LLTEWTPRFIPPARVVFRRYRVHDDVDRGNPFFCQPTMPSNMWYTDRKPSRPMIRTPIFHRRDRRDPRVRHDEAFLRAGRKKSEGKGAVTNAKREVLAEASVLDDPVGQLIQVRKGDAVPAQEELGTTSPHLISIHLT